MRIRTHKPHQFEIDLISHKLVGVAARFKTFKHRGQQAGAFGGRLKSLRVDFDGFDVTDLTTLTEPLGNA